MRSRIQEMIDKVAIGRYLAVHEIGRNQDSQQSLERIRSDGGGG